MNIRWLVSDRDGDGDGDEEDPQEGGSDGESDFVSCVGDGDEVSTDEERARRIRTSGAELRR